MIWWAAEENARNENVRIENNFHVFPRALATALELDDRLVEVSAVPVAAAVADAFGRQAATLRWRRWIAHRRELAYPEALEAAAEIAADGDEILDPTSANGNGSDDISALAREIDVILGTLEAKR